MTGADASRLQNSLGAPAATLLGQIAAAVAPGRVAVCGETARQILGDGHPNAVSVSIEGDLAALGQKLTLGDEVQVRSNLRTVTVSLRFPDGPQLNLAVSHSVVFDRPGALPVRTASRLEDALVSRDFGIDAMALVVSPDSRITVLDPYGARDDIGEGRLRLLDGEGFHLDPPRLLRAVRLATDLGLTMDGDTASSFQAAIDDDSASAVSADRLRFEWNVLTASDDPTEQLVALRRSGAHAVAYLPDIDEDTLHGRSLAVSAGLAIVGERADVGDAYLCGWVFDAPRDVRSASLARLAVPQARVGRFRLPDVPQPLDDRDGCWAALSPLRPTELAAFCASGRSDVRSALQHYGDELARRTGRDRGE